MKTGTHLQKKSVQHSTAAPVENALVSRSFPLQPETESASSPDLETAATLGHNFGNVSLFAPATESMALPIQPKLTIGQVGDKYEQEADKVAAQVVSKINAPATPPVQRHQDEDELKMKPDVQRHQDEDELQMKPDVQRHQDEEEAIQRHTDNHASFQADSSLESRIKQTQGSGQTLDEGVRSFMEPRFGHSFADVRVHTGSDAVQMNQELHAQAFTNGKHIYFNQGKYNPSSDSGKKLLAHELTHTIQQTGGSQLQRQAEIGHSSVGCQCPTCVPTSPSIQRQITLNQSINNQNLLNRRLIDVVQPHLEPAHNSGCQCPTCGVSQIQRQLEANHASGCTCPTCSPQKALIQTKLTVGAPGDKYEQEADSVAAQVMRMTEPKPADSIQRHEEEELAQTKPMGQAITPLVQKHEQKDKLTQTKLISAGNTPIFQKSPDASVIQRHSSWEHQLLGDAKPEELAQIGAWQNLIEQTKLTGSYGFRKPATKEATVTIPGVQTPIKKGNVMHVIAQELQRLNEWQNNPPTKASSGEIDPKYQTVLVSIPGGGKNGEPLIITYGELNTLADYYGNIDTMKTADPKVRWEIIQSVRQETFFRLRDIYKQLKDSLTDTEEKDANVTGAEAMMANNQRVNQKVGYKFQDAILQDYISGDYGQINLLTATGTGAKKQTDEYGATLARNACHFVPESWHAWASYHQKAREAAHHAYNLQQRAEDIYGALSGSSEEQTDLLQEFHQCLKQAEEATNEALLNNGFGDHYLQDSYAAGHMINKTKIMQWFVQWLDTQAWTMDFASAETWRKIQQIAYNQPDLAASIYDQTQIQGYDATQTTNRAKNPQAVEDIPGNDWKVRFDALGLQVPASLRTPGSNQRKLMEWWQTQAMSNQAACTQTEESLLRNSPLKNATQLNSALASLTNDRIVRFNKTIIGVNEYILGTEYVPKHGQQFHNALAASKGDQNTNTPPDDSQYQSMAALATYGNYLEFLNNTYVQKSTNALHNVFCKEGIEITDARGNPLFWVYGDDAMFNKDSAVGVKHSGETANMSRDAIRNIIKSGGDGGYTTGSILARLPNFVKPKAATAHARIDIWHNPAQGGQLKSYCETNVFPSMGMIDKSLALIGSATSGLSAFISKDKQKVHGAEAF